MEFETLDTYYTIAKKTISSYGWKHYPSLVKDMLSNSDTISMVAHAIMVADWKWDAEKVGPISGQSKSRYSYRNQRAIWAIQKYVSDKYKSNQKHEKHVEHIVKNSDQLSSDPADIFEEKDSREQLTRDIKTIIDSCDLTDKQREQMIMYYYDNKTLKEIGDHFNLTKEAVRLNIKKAVQKLRELIGVNIES